MPTTVPMGSDGGSSRRARALALGALLASLALARLLPHPPNVTPLTAVALLGGAGFGSVWAALGVPLVAMLLSDVALEVTSGMGFHATMPWVYGAFAAVACFGWWWLRRRRLHWGRLVVASLAASTWFFVVTNFGVWLQGTLYPKTAAGLWTCYVAALPFFRNALLGDMAFVLGFFALWHVAERRWLAGAYGLRRVWERDAARGMGRVRAGEQ